MNCDLEVPVVLHQVEWKMMSS